MPRNSPKRSSPTRKPKVEPDRDVAHMREALELARKGVGTTSPNPAVGALLVRSGRVLGRGWHRRAGEPHAEVEAFESARKSRRRPKGATLYVTLEPCSTQGRTPPCTDAIIRADVACVVVGGVDPNPRHAGRGLDLLRAAGIEVRSGVLEKECTDLNRAFNHWMLRGTPWTLLKAAMTLDGKIATAEGESKWITGLEARDRAMAWRQAADAILVGVNTVLADDPSLTVRMPAKEGGEETDPEAPRQPWRIVLDSHARTPVKAKVLQDTHARRTIIAVTKSAPEERVAALARKVAVWEVSSRDGRVDLGELMRRLGEEEVTHLMVEGGGEVMASFLEQGLAHEVCFFYASKILGGHGSRRVVGGEGAGSLSETTRLKEVQWSQVGEDLLMQARVEPGKPKAPSPKPAVAKPSAAREPGRRPTPKHAPSAPETKSKKRFPKNSNRGRRPGPSRPSRPVWKKPKPLV